MCHKTISARDCKVTYISDLLVQHTQCCSTKTICLRRHFASQHYQILLWLFSFLDPYSLLSSVHIFVVERENKVSLRRLTIRNLATCYRLVSTFQRPSITMWSGHRLRAVYNHFHHHSEVKAKGLLEFSIIHSISRGV